MHDGFFENRCVRGLRKCSTYLNVVKLLFKVYSLRLRTAGTKRGPPPPTPTPHERTLYTRVSRILLDHYVARSLIDTRTGKTWILLRAGKKKKTARRSAGNARCRPDRPPDRVTRRSPERQTARRAAGSRRIKRTAACAQTFTPSSAAARPRRRATDNELPPAAARPAVYTTRDTVVRRRTNDPTPPPG